MTRDTFLDAAAAAVGLLRDPAVAAAWNAPSALPVFTVSGLAGHLARQIFHVRNTVAQDPAGEHPITLLDHYARSRWAGAELDDDVNVRIRRDGEHTASEGPAALAARAGAAVDALRTALPAQPSDRAVHLPWGPWSLTLDDFLITRMLEITIHCDDLAYSVGVETPPQPPEAIAAVVTLLAQLAVRRHGSTAVLRALSRAERAPDSIAAI